MCIRLITTYSHFQSEFPKSGSRRQSYGQCNKIRCSYLPVHREVPAGCSSYDNHFYRFNRFNHQFNLIHTADMFETHTKFGP